MNKEQLVNTIAEKLDVTKKQSLEFINAFTDVVTEELSSGGDIRLIGFGTFTTKHRASRNGTNPQNGEKLVIPSRAVAYFKPGKELKDAVYNVVKK